MIINVGINAKKNEHPTRRYSLTTAPSAKNRAKEAPNAAPAAIPNVKGLASGFFKVPCIIVPAAASPNPTRMAKIIRGSLRSQTLSSPNVSVDRPWNIIEYTSETLSGKQPSATAMPAITRTMTKKRIIYFIFFLINLLGSLQHYVGKLGDNSNLPVTR